MFYLLNYTRKPVSSILYDARLAYSMHLAISDDGEKFQALNHNSGVLFVKPQKMKMVLLIRKVSKILLFFN